LRGTSRREDGRDPGGPMDSAAALEGARRYLSGLQPEDHHGDGVAQPPYRVANPWGQGYDREPRAGASELPSTDPQPRVRCGKAASCEGRSRGLSCMKGNFHVQFLGEGVAATSPPYPTPGWATTQVYPAFSGLGHGSNAGHSSGVPGVDARRATPPDPRLARWGLARCCQLDPSHPALGTREDPGVEPGLIPCGPSWSLSRLPAWPGLRSPLLERPGIASALHA